VQIVSYINTNKDYLHGQKWKSSVSFPVFIHLHSSAVAYSFTLSFHAFPPHLSRVGQSIATFLLTCPYQKHYMYTDHCHKQNMYACHLLLTMSVKVSVCVEDPDLPGLAWRSRQTRQAVEQWRFCWKGSSVVFMNHWHFFILYNFYVLLDFVIKWDPHKLNWRTQAWRDEVFRPAKQSGNDAVVGRAVLLFLWAIDTSQSCITFMLCWTL